MTPRSVPADGRGRGLRTVLLAGAVAILLGAVTAAVAVWRATSPPATAPPAAAAPVALAAPLEAPPVVPVAPAAPAAHASPAAPRAPRPTATSSGAAPAAADLFRRLRPLGERVARCVAARDPTATGRARAVVSLELVTGEGRVRVASATPIAPAPEALAACVQAELAGQELDVPGAVSGRRYHMPYPVRY